MRIVKIEKFSNGAHENQFGNDVLPEGYAVVPENMETENFPFGDITVETVNGVPTVTSWTPLPIPPEVTYPEE